MWKHYKVCIDKTNKGLKFLLKKTVLFQSSCNFQLYLSLIIYYFKHKTDYYNCYVVL